MFCSSCGARKVSANAMCGSCGSQPMAYPQQQQLQQPQQPAVMVSSSSSSASSSSASSSAGGGFRAGAPSVCQSVTILVLVFSALIMMATQIGSSRWVVISADGEDLVEAGPTEQCILTGYNAACTKTSDLDDSMLILRGGVKGDLETSEACGALAVALASVSLLLVGIATVIAVCFRRDTLPPALLCTFQSGEIVGAVAALFGIIASIALGVATGKAVDNVTEYTYASSASYETKSACTVFGLGTMFLLVAGLMRSCARCCCTAGGCCACAPGNDCGCFDCCENGHASSAASASSSAGGAMHYSAMS